MDQFGWKACPFCGNPPRYAMEKDEALTSHNIVDWHRVTCSWCDIQMTGTDLDELRAQWNQRNAVEHCETCVGLSEARTIENGALRQTVAVLREWSLTFGSALRPPSADTYGDGVRDAKGQVGRILDRTKRDDDTELWELRCLAEAALDLYRTHGEHTICNVSPLCGACAACRFCEALDPYIKRRGGEVA